ncbi:paxillin-like protein [Arthroderma uncinatum]|uniref:paxillin-like protein n=1 Tax=Arthroderma uncinatum TaxID=74035 RepID=UPI00144AF619|nr:paxillin-like protein [Arthroderma uncinatum]KAF3482014.1 paxillin-like protein [Arthroderma uncinatum]
MDGIKIKCSDCHAEVELIALGEHFCSKPPPASPVSTPVEQQSPISEWNEHGPPPKRSLSRESLFNRLGRVAPPPKIDPTAANRPFLSHGAQLSPHTGGFGAISPLSASPLSPFQQPQRSQTTPIPPPSPSPVSGGKLNLDCAFPPFPRPASAGGSKAKKLTTAINTNVSSHRGIASPSPSEGSYMSPSTDGRRSRANTANRHRREASIDSKTFQRMSMASSRNGHGLPSPISPGGTSRGLFVDEDIPPLPSGPITGLAASPVFTSGNSEPFNFGSNNDNDNQEEHDFGGEISPKDKVRQLDGMEGLDFGFTSRAKSPDHMDVDNKSENMEMDYSEKDPESPGPSVPEYRVDREFSVSNFASGLGLGDPYHTTNDSTSSSNSSPSEAPSNSSFSSRPSESSIVSEPKSAESDKHNDDHLHLLEEPPVRPNADPYSYGLDSPTDPLFQQGRLSDPPASRRPSRTDSEYPPAPMLETPPKQYIPFRSSSSPCPSPNLQSPSFEQQQQQQPQQQQQQQQKPQEKEEQQPQQEPQQRELPQTLPPLPQEEPQIQSLPPSRSTTPGKRRHPCRGCGDIITGKSVSSADGRLTGRYHKACFVCHTCRAPFQTADFYVLDNHPYCAADYHRLNGTLCAECGQGIEGPCLEAEDVVDSPSHANGEQPDNSTKKKQKFHPGCFKCRTCHIVLRGDYFEWNGSAYCERDGRRAAGMMPPPRSPGGYPPPHNYHGNQPPSPLSMHPVGPHGQPGPGPGSGYRRPPYASSPLAGPPHNGRGDPRHRPMNPSSLRPRPDQHRPHPSQNKFANTSSLAPGPPNGGPRNGPGYPPGRKFPERRTTKLMMV